MNNIFNLKESDALIKAMIEEYQAAQKLFEYGQKTGVKGFIIEGDTRKSCIVGIAFVALNMYPVGEEREALRQKFIKLFPSGKSQ